MCKLGIKPFCYFIALRVPAQLHNTKFQYQKNNRQTTTTATTFNPKKKILNKISQLSHMYSFPPFNSI